MHFITVGFLRKSGYKVAVIHERKYDSSGKKLPKGGQTKLIIDSPNGKHFEGISKCCEEDNYNKKLGVRIALGRSGVKTDAI